MGTPRTVPELMQDTPFYADPYYTDGTDGGDIDLLAAVHDERRAVKVYRRGTRPTASLRPASTASSPLPGTRPVRWPGGTPRLCRGHARDACPTRPYATDSGVSERPELVNRATDASGPVRARTDGN